MGLGAGFKLSDKEKAKREKEKEKDRDKDDNVAEGKDEAKEKEERYREGLRDLQQRLKQEQEEHVHPATASGWTSILESWFCYGEQHNPVARRMKDPSGPDNLERALSTGDIRRKPGGGALVSIPGLERKGPYEMLVKERMMGLYLVIFIHRDARHLLQGSFTIPIRVHYPQ